MPNQKLADKLIKISVANQQLDLYALQDGKLTNLICSYPIATSKNGLGELKNSFCTPRGEHYIRAKIGKDLPINSVLKARRPTGEIYSNKLANQPQNQNRDWILTRILWLCGQEKNFNRLGNKDTFWRMIYIHGAPDHKINGQLNSKGCINMKNKDMIELFDLVSVKDRVIISE